MMYSISSISVHVSRRLLARNDRWRRRRIRLCVCVCERWLQLRLLFLSGFYICVCATQTHGHIQNGSHLKRHRNIEVTPSAINGRWRKWKRKSRPAVRPIRCLSCQPEHDAAASLQRICMWMLSCFAISLFAIGWSGYCAAANMRITHNACHATHEGSHILLLVSYNIG